MPIGAGELPFAHVYAMTYRPFWIVELLGDGLQRETARRGTMGTHAQALALALRR